MNYYRRRRHNLHHARSIDRYRFRMYCTAYIFHIHPYLERKTTILYEKVHANKIYKWNYLNATTSTLFTADSCTSNNSTKATPSVSCDLLGDWREEFILRKTDNTSLRIFTTTISAQNRLITLMHDPQYRAAVAWQNSSYNQPPHPSYYLGDGMSEPPRPNIDVEPLTTDVNDIKTSAIRVFPNPSVHGFIIETKGDFSFKIYDLKGQMLENGRGIDQTTVGTRLSRGAFVIHINQEGKEEVIKIVKE